MNIILSLLKQQKNTFPKRILKKGDLLRKESAEDLEKAKKDSTVRKITLPTSQVYSLFVAYLVGQEIFPNPGHMMSTFNTVTTLMTLSSYRFKEQWYQEGGNRLEKVKTDQKTKQNNFSEYGIGPEFYHFTFMCNLPLETKSRLRDMTRVGTDIMDLIDLWNGQNTRMDEKKIIAALRKKLPHFVKNRVLELFLKKLKRSVTSSGRSFETQGYVSLFLSIVQAKMLVQETRFSLLAFAYAHWGGAEVAADFTAQGAFSLYKKLQEHSVSEPLKLKHQVSEAEGKYAFCSAF